MVYVVYDVNTGKCEDIAYSKTSLIPKGKSYIEVSKNDWISSQGKDKKVINGQFIYSDPLPTINDYNKALEDHLKEERIARGYTLREPSEYKGSTVERWAQDAEDWIVHRDEVMMYGLNIQNTYKETGNAPSLEEFKENLPKITWTIE